jgi:hypothetical protein
MNKLCNPMQRIVHLKLLITLKGGWDGFVMPLTLIGMLVAIGTAESRTLKLETTWPGLYDTETGWDPGVGFPPRCVANARPTIAVSNANELHLAGNFNYAPYRRGGTTPFRFNIATFFGNGLLPNGVQFGTPALVYDERGDRTGGGGRFTIVGTARQTAAPQASWILVGTTAASLPPPNSPNVTDCTYRMDANVEMSIPPTPYFADSVRVGLTGDSIVITADMRDFVNSNFQTSKLWVLPKTGIYNVPLHNCPLLNPTPSLIKSGFKMPGGNSPAQALVPAKSYDASSPVTYLLSAWGGSGTELAQWSLDTRQLSISPGVIGASMPTTAYSSPPMGVVQQGTTIRIGAGGAALLTNAVLQPTSGLWTVHPVACPWDSTLSCFKWYQISGKVVQDAFFGYSSSVGVSSYDPAVAVNKQGAALFAFGASGPTQYPSVYYAGRDAVDPINQLAGSGFILKNGVGPYRRQGVTLNDPGGRSSVDTDPADDNRFWLVGGYASRATTCPDGSTQDDWATQVGAVSFSNPPGAP